jgi:integrase
MGSVNFYLKKAEKKTGKSLIYLQFKYNGKKFVYTFGQTINPKNWNSKKNRVKSNQQTTADGKHSLNDLLQNLQDLTEKTYNELLKNGIPTNDMLRQPLDTFINQNEGKADGPTFHKLLERFISGEIKHKGKEKSINTIKTYRTLQGHLKAFERVYKMPIDYHSLDLNFLYKYTTFLRRTFKDSELVGIQDEKIKKALSSLPIGQNAIAKDVQILKTVMKKAVTLGESKYVHHEHEEFTAARADTDAVFLTDKEIISLYRYDFSNNKRIEQVRDLFVFGCCVGLRYSDYSNIKPEHIIHKEGEYFIKMKTQKTGELVIIPCNPVVLQIFDKYAANPNKLPTTISNQKFNDYIKEACKDAGLTEVGRLSTEPTKPLYECISSHTARRSFATNLYLESFPVMDLMRITGHKTEKAFRGYIRHTKLDSAKKLSEHNKRTWSQKLLNIASAA